jgi:hypothetical protein
MRNRGRNGVAPIALRILTPGSKRITTRVARQSTIQFLKMNIRRWRTIAQGESANYRRILIIH